MGGKSNKRTGMTMCITCHRSNTHLSPV